MTTFKATYEGQEFRRTSKTRSYAWAVIVSGPITDKGVSFETTWKAVSWARTRALAEKKGYEFRKTYLVILVIPAISEEEKPASRLTAGGGSGRPLIPKVPADKCRRCGGRLTGEDSLARGYGDKCWRKHRAEERALEGQGDIVQQAGQDTTGPDPEGQKRPIPQAAAVILDQAIGEAVQKLSRYDIRGINQGE